MRDSFARRNFLRGPLLPAIIVVEMREDHPVPTPGEVENAAFRAEIAARQAKEFAEAMRLAESALGPGWTPWMKLVLIDADHRRSGDTEPVATVYKVYYGERRLTEHSRFLRRMPDGQVRTADSYEPLFGELLCEKHPTRKIEVRGQQVPVGKYELCWSALELYQPKTAEELARLRASREQRKAEREQERWAAENPLLAWAERSNHSADDTKPEGPGR